MSWACWATDHPFDMKYELTRGLFHRSALFVDQFFRMRDRTAITARRMGQNGFFGGLYVHTGRLNCGRLSQDQHQDRDADETAQGRQGGPGRRVFFIGPIGPAITVTWLTTGRALSTMNTSMGRPLIPNRWQNSQQTTGATPSRTTIMVGRPRIRRRFFSPSS